METTNEGKTYKTPEYTRRAMKSYYERKKQDPAFVAKNRERAKEYARKKREASTKN